ncbi:MAG: 30S ribosomal protein S18 [bacterium]
MKKKIKKKTPWIKVKRKYCLFCQEKIKEISFLDYEIIRKELSERGKILSRRITKTCAKHQRMMTRAIKQARELALLSYTSK